MGSCTVRYLAHWIRHRRRRLDRRSTDEFGGRVSDFADEIIENSVVQIGIQRLQGSDDG